MKKHISLFLLLALFLSFQLLLPSLAVGQQASTNPTASRTLRIAGLRSSVTVRRDGRGIPYIEAANEADLYLAQGYVTASDRLFQMELFRRTVRGELAE